ncbi:MAG TPA: NUDIX hydrolase [Chloroflexi bacterium]|nr:NUDIX hydrolase [Chloroflexota bacterium]
MSEEKIVSSQLVFEGRIFDLRVETVARSDGKTYQREMIIHNGAVAMVPLDEDGNVILVRQYRAGAEKVLLEIPAGMLEDGEEPLAAARRELQEEIGYYPEELTRLGLFYVAASYTTEAITIYLARGLRPSRLPQDIDEYITVERMPFRQALQQALDNDIEDAKTLIGLVWAARHLDGK